MFNKKKNININYTVNNNYIKEEKTLNFIKDIIPLLTFLSAILTSLITFSKFITAKIILSKNYIYNSSLITINSSEIITNSFIAVAISILFILAFIQIKKIIKIDKKECISKEKKKNIKIANLKKIVKALFSLTLGTTLLNYELILTQKKLLMIISILISTIISYCGLSKIKVDDLKSDSIVLGFSIILTIVIIPIFPSFFSSSNTNNLAQIKNNNTEIFDKIIIYSNKEQSILCNYFATEENKIQPDCTIYEIVNNEDIIIKLYKEIE